MKKILWSIVLVLWMIIIFIFSNQTGTESKTTSNQFSDKIVEDVAVIMNKNISDHEKERILDDASLLVRKTAHFTLYFILGIFAYYTFTTYGIKKTILYSILFCFIYACSDEIHQLFLSGRDGNIFDVFVDSMGSISSMIPIVVMKR